MSDIPITEEIRIELVVRGITPDQPDYAQRAAQVALELLRGVRVATPARRKLDE